MHVLKPESINNSRKNIQNVLTNIQKIYLYIYKHHSKEWVDSMHKIKLENELNEKEEEKTTTAI